MSAKERIKQFDQISSEQANEVAKVPRRNNRVSVVLQIKIIFVVIMI